MNRIDRLTAILIFLQTKRIIRAKDIADRYEVSLRTVYRDIRALEDAGVPIGAQPGEGYFIVDGYHLPPVMFTREEASALFIGGKLIENFSDISVRKHFIEALDKIKAILPNDDKEHIDRLNFYIEVLKGPQAKKDGFPNNSMSEIQSLLGRNRVILIAYHSGYKDELTLRKIEPLGLCFYAGNWHLIAYCMLRNDYRDFRVDRIKRLNVTDNTFRPEKHESLQDLIKKMILSEDLKPAVLRFDKESARFISEQKYYFGFIHEKMLKNQVEMTFMVPSYSVFARWVLSFIDEVEVVSPKELINQVRNYSKKAFEHYQ